MSPTRNTDPAFAQRAALVARLGELLVTDALVDALVDLAIEIAEAKLRERLIAMLGGADGEEDTKPNGARNGKGARKRLLGVRARSSDSAKRVGPRALVPARADRALDQANARTRDASKKSKGTTRQRAVMKCSKCGELGKRADGCGKSHNVSRTRKSSSDDAEEESEAVQLFPPKHEVNVLPPPPTEQNGSTTRAERFARLEAAARAREAARGR